MHDAEPRPCRPVESLPQFAEATRLTHARQKAPATQRYMNGMAAMMEWALRVRHVPSERVSPFSRSCKRKAELSGRSR
jgi:hypothetical protein